MPILLEISSGLKPVNHHPKAPTKNHLMGPLFSGQNSVSNNPYFSLKIDPFQVKVLPSVFLTD